MEKAKVYIGVYRSDYRESLFYQENSADKLYLDMVTDEVVSIEELDSDVLVPYNEVIECKSNLKVNIIKMYNFDRKQKISLSRVLLGTVFEIVNSTANVDYDQTDDKLVVSSQTVYDVKKVGQESLLYALDGCENMDYSDFLNMETGKVYKSDSKLGNGSQYVIRNGEYLSPIKRIFDIDEEMIEKGKLLRKYREYRGGNL